MNVKLRSLKTKEWSVPIPASLDKNLYFYRHNLTQKVTIRQDPEAKEDMVDLFFEGIQVEKNQFYMFSSTKVIEDQFFNVPKRSSSNIDGSVYSEDSIPDPLDHTSKVVTKAEVHKQQSGATNNNNPHKKVAKKGPKDATKEASKENVAQLPKIPKKAAEEYEAALSQALDNTDDGSQFAEQRLSRESSKDNLKSPGHDGSQEEMAAADRSVHDLSASDSEDDVESKVAARDAAVATFGDEDESSSSSESDKSNKSSDSDEDFVDDSMYATQQKKKHNKSSSKAKEAAKEAVKTSRKDFTLTSATGTILKFKKKAKEDPPPQAGKTSKLKRKKHTKVEKPKQEKTFTQTVIPTSKKAPSETIDVTSSPNGQDNVATSNEKADEQEQRRPDVDSFNDEVARRLAKAKMKDKLASLDTQPSVSTPAVTGGQAPRKQIKEKFVTEQTAGRRRTRNSQQTAAGSEPPPKKSKAKEKPNTSLPTPIAKEPIPEKLRQNFTTILSPISEKAKQAMRDEINGEDNGNFVDGDAANLPDFM